MRIELRSLTKSFGPVRALAGVSVAFEAARVSVVMGANGSGKSTLLAIVGALARASSGTVDHGDIGRTPEAVRAALGWLGHESLCYPDLSGKENIHLAARLYGVDPDAAYSLAEARFALGGYALRQVRTYSRGQRQRIALARALVHGPRLLLLDEPTTGLDEESVRRLAVVVKEEAARGAVVVVVTHDAEFAKEIADVRIVLARGRVASESA